MGEINFLSSNTSSGSSDSGAKDQKKKKQAEDDTKWTEAKAGDSKETNTIFGLTKNKQVKQSKGADSGNKQRIEKSRQEVLEMIDKNKKPKKKKATKKGLDKKKKNSEDKEVVPPKSSSWIGKILHNQSETKPEDDKPDKVVATVKKEEAKNKDTSILNKDKKIGVVESPVKSQASNGDSPLIFNSNTWNSSGVLATNLIDKSELGFFDSEKKFKYIAISVLGALCLVGVLYLGLLYWEHTELKKLIVEKESIAKLETKVREAGKDLDTFADFQKKLDTASALLNKHIYWTNFFNFLEKTTLNNVYYVGDIDFAIDDQISLSARFPDYATLKNQLMVFANNPSILNITQDGDVAPYEEEITEGDKGLALDIGQEAEATSTEPLMERGVEAPLLLDIDRGIFYKESVASTSTDDNIR